MVMSLAMRLQRLERIGQAIVRAAVGVREPVPVLKVSGRLARGGATPLPKKKAQKRLGRAAGGSACDMASSQGKASDRPAPRRKVRRSRCQEARAWSGFLCVISTDCYAFSTE